MLNKGERIQAAMSNQHLKPQITDTVGLYVTELQTLKPQAGYKRWTVAALHNVFFVFKLSLA